MTHEELIAKAVAGIHLYERHAGSPPARIKGLKVDELQHRKVREAVVVSFESDADVGRIEATLDRHSGEVMEIKLVPPKEGADGQGS